ncbi:MAG: hypothetical protein COW65_11955 [Cytophagales bacterium CG18_big_fil_WC_8_21_14_2_50_42_9]|nr:MAG: hypothetical protein COW65_11955 [Cytophagales bacterium CG18_big_fil_WC_8_21_14_2_50_42_9]
MYYNPIRRHASLKYLSPIKFEQLFYNNYANLLPVFFNAPQVTSWCSNTYLYISSALILNVA